VCVGRPCLSLLHTDGNGGRELGEMLVEHCDVAIAQVVPPSTLDPCRKELEHGNISSTSSAPSVMAAQDAAM